MASSRWKRFAFFERHSLSLPSEVLENLIPQGSLGGSGYSARQPRDYGIENPVPGNAVSLVVTSAALPLKSRPVEKGKSNKARNEQVTPEEEYDSMLEMWSTLTACTGPDVPTVPIGTVDLKPGAGTKRAAAENLVVSLPSQSQTLHEQQDAPANTPSNTTLDGLVLVFIASPSTPLVHCFDITVRCNPPDDNGKDLEDLDGWRGYFNPFAELPSKKPSSREISSNSTVGSDSTDGKNKATPAGISGIAVCRSANDHHPVYLAFISQKKVCVWEDPHLFLSCRRPITPPRPGKGKCFRLLSPWNSSKDGNPCVLDVAPGLLAVGTDNGTVLVFLFGGASTNKLGLRLYVAIPPPPTPGLEAAVVKISMGSAAMKGKQDGSSSSKIGIFVAYNRSSSQMAPMSTAGVCCYDLPVPGNNTSTISAPSARHDLDGRQVSSLSLCDTVPSSEGMNFTVARPDGLYTYSQTQKVGVAPIDGDKLAICMLPPPLALTSRPTKDATVGRGDMGSSYALVASTDTKSDRDAVDIYDATNKLVAFHLLLSPGHRAMRAAGVTTQSTRIVNGASKGGRSSAVVITSGGSLVSLTEKSTTEKVSLLVQKNLYSAAIVVAFADPSYDEGEITMLYRKHAEHLYRKGDFSASIDQYIHTIGSLEASHVIFRFLDAPKLPLLVKYLEELRSREMATPVHNELLRTCYLKLNDTESAEAIAASSSSSLDYASLSSLLSGLTTTPRDALVTICSLEAPQAAEALVTYGSSLARVLPREIAGVVVSLCVGTYSPKALADAATSAAAEANKMLEQVPDDRPKACEPYSVQFFASAFLENPKMLRLILAHCNRNKCPLVPSLRRTLLELTLAEWNQAKRSGDTEAEKQRHKEAIAALTDSHSREIGDYDALVIVQRAGFDEGELLLYERLQMGPMLLERYAKDGSEKSRRQMLAMCQNDPEILATVLGHFVAMASEKMDENQTNDRADDDSEDDTTAILEDIEELLSLARRQGVLPPVRIARILGGEGTDQFSADGGADTAEGRGRRTVPLSVALDYVGSILDESRKEVSRLKSEVEEYNQLCNRMEAEVASLLRASLQSPHIEAREQGRGIPARMNIEEMHARVKLSMDDGDKFENKSEQSKEAFWREMSQSEDSFETIARFFAKGVIQ